MPYMGIDVGGTNLAAGLVDDDLRIIASAKCKMNLAGVEKTLAQEIVSLCDKCIDAAGMKREDIEYIGIGVPGVMDRAWGIINYCSNIPFHNTPIRSMIQSIWDIPVYLENDAGCAAIGEQAAGAAKGYQSAVVITLGTGVGGGIIIDNRLFRGIGGDGSEIGHMVIEAGGAQCKCGRKGCWEAYSSATGLKRMTVEAMLADKSSAMWAITDNDISKVGGRTAFQAAKLGDKAGMAVAEKFVSYLAVGIGNIINIFRPGIVVIGGGVSNEEDKLLFDPLREQISRECYAPDIAPPAIVRATLGNDAGILGAALLGRIQ